MEKEIIKAIKTELPNIPIYHDFAYENSPVPLVVIQRIGGVGYLYLEDKGDYQVRFHIAVWCDDRLQAIEYSRKIENAILSQLNSVAMGAAVAMADPETGKRGMGQDFMIY